MPIPRVTVVMPAYNAERFIDEAIQSIQGQTLNDWELIIVNDGSTDETGVIASRHAAEDPRIRVIHQDNAGQAVANNRAIAESRTQYIARMDADDFAFTRRLESLIESLDRDAELAVVGSNVWLCDEAGSRLMATRLPSTDGEIRALLFRKQRNCLCNPAIAFRRDVWIRAGGERQCFGHAHDLDLTLRMARFGRLLNIREPLLGYRIHASQVSIGQASQQGVCAYAAYIALQKREQTGTEPRFVDFPRPVEFADIETEGANGRRARQFIIAHLVDSHMRLCLLNACDSAAGVRRTAMELVQEHGEQWAAMFPIMEMTARESRRAACRKRAWATVREMTSWLATAFGHRSTDQKNDW